MSLVLKVTSKRRVKLVGTEMAPVAAQLRRPHTWAVRLGALHLRSVTYTTPNHTILGTCQGHTRVSLVVTCAALLPLQPPLLPTRGGQRGPADTSAQHPHGKACTLPCAALPLLAFNYNCQAPTWQRPIPAPIRLAMLSWGVRSKPFTPNLYCQAQTWPPSTSWGRQPTLHPDPHFHITSST